MVCLVFPCQTVHFMIIVSDNSINQTILSTFMKKKKIKYDVAKNGKEAVEKWWTGGFHIVLVRCCLFLGANILMKKKKIKYYVAKNGKEAVEKCGTGGFHIALVRC